jgi:hypothetical protein
MAGDTVARGYGAAHRRLRRQLDAVVQAGDAWCVRCGVWIAPAGEPCPRCGDVTCGWDLGHVDGDKSLHQGHEHACCNRSAGASRGNRLRGLVEGRRQSREW